MAQNLLEEGNYTQAKAQIAQAELASFESLYTELEGDIYLAQDDRQEAEKAYLKVLSALEVENPRYVIVKLKHDDVTGSEGKPNVQIAYFILIHRIAVRLFIF